MSKLSELDAVISAMHALKLHNDYYAASADFSDRAREIADELQTKAELPDNSLRRTVADAIRKSFCGG